MMLKHKWLMFLLAPVVLTFGFFLFLLGANYYYAKRATYVLQRIRALKIDNSSIAELKRLGSEHGLRYDEPDNCTDRPYLHIVSPNNQWMQSLLKSPTLARLGEHVGLRGWLAVGDIELFNQQVTGKVYAVAFFQGHLNPEVDLAAWDERDSEVDLCSYYPLKRHPGYAFRNATNIRSFRALVSTGASAQNRSRAFQFNLKCLTSWQECGQFSELMPAAWADYEEDGKWSEIHPNKLGWQVGTKCPY